MTTCSIEHQKWQVLGPSDALINKLRAFPTDHTEEMKSYLNCLLSTFMESLKSTISEEKTLVRAEKCCFKAKERYYKILESFLLNKDLTNVAVSLSETKSFQCSLVLCCLEMAFYTNKLAYNFTPLLERFDLAAYDLFKAVYVVLCTQVDLTSDIKKHLENVVALIIEKLAWTQKSPLWEEISTNEGRLPTCQQVMSPEELEGPVAMTQLDHDTNLTITDSTTDDQKSTLNRPHRRRFIHPFTRGVYWSVHNSLSRLCSMLKLQDEQQQKIWTCFEYSLVHHFDLLRDQHVDWLLLCAIHSMTKVAEREIPLRLIINCYKSLPKKNIDAMEMLKGNSAISLEQEHNKDRILTPSSPSLKDPECDQISCFYSRVYAPIMGQFLKKFRPTPGVETPPLSPYPTPPSTRKRRVCDHLNVFVSQWNKQTASPALEGMCYDFHSSPSQCLRDINSAIKSHGNPQKRRRLQLDEGSDGGPSANSLQKRILAVQHDRAQLNVAPPSDQSINL
ncbi:unnamed protein product [Knipowitschia caucasica]